MKNFQQIYDNLLRNQQQIRDDFIATWELYDKKEEILNYLESHDDGLVCYNIIAKRLYLTWYIKHLSIEDAIKSLLVYFPDLDTIEKTGPEINLKASLKNFPVKITLNLSDSATCERVHVDDEVRPIYMYKCS